ncbi:hypothetical protein Pmani_029098 [Petrolisthes manimaculis]|uniref:Secreted protein n=1 Tax=Petrolisthes manimaculis TaxID=1843537 RepID=A0AAE1NY93_9EUCA|nr:hypothetical protein Pmani_029098 [Petrolisthes manimaculis]
MLTLCCLAVLAPPRPTARQVTSVLPFTGVWPALVLRPGGPELGSITECHAGSFRLPLEESEWWGKGSSWCVECLGPHHL